MAHGVVLDTGFLITLVGPERTHHETAKRYWKHFKENGIPPFLSVIVISEFEVKQKIPDDIHSACIPLVFNVADAQLAAKLEQHREKEPETERTAVKDDLKIIAQAAVQDVAFVITDDSKSFGKYCQRLSGIGIVKFKTLVLEDGFNEALLGLPSTLL